MTVDSEGRGARQRQAMPARRLPHRAAGSGLHGREHAVQRRKAGLQSERARLLRFDVRHLHADVAASERREAHRIEAQHAARRVTVPPPRHEHAAFQVEAAGVGEHLAPLDAQGLAIAQQSQPQPIGHGHERRNGRRRGSRLEQPGDIRTRPRCARGQLHGSAHPEEAVADGEARFELVLHRRLIVLVIEPPARVAGAVPDGGGHRLLAPRVQTRLRREQLAEPARAASDVEHARRHTVRLGADRDDDSAGRFLPHPIVAASEAGDRAELIAGDKHRRRGYARGRQELAPHPCHGVALVRQPNLDVLDVAGNARRGQPMPLCELAGQPDGRRQPALEAARTQPVFDSAQEFAEASLGRVGPLRDGDEVDLAPVEPVVDDPHIEPRRGNKAVAQPLGDGRERGFFGRGRLAKPPPNRRAVAAESVHLGAAIGADEHPGAPAGRDVADELPFDVTEVGAGHHDNANPGPQQPGYRHAQFGGVLLPAGHGRAVPVEHDGPEDPAQRRWAGSVSDGHRAASRGGYGRRCF